MFLFIAIIVYAIASRLFLCARLLVGFCDMNRRSR